MNAPARFEAQPSRYAIATWFLLRLLGLVYLFAFWSLATQIRGLVGNEGILPAREYMAAIADLVEGDRVGPGQIFQWPTLFWLSTDDGFLIGVSTAGAVLGALLAIGVAPALLLPLLWAAFLSLNVVCRDFLSYQWDALLLETGLLAIPLAPLTWWHSPRDRVDPPWIARWLVWWLLFRLMFGSGVVKLASGDPTWRDLTAMTFHYETQPLPTPLAWYVSRLPDGFHKATTAAVLALELTAPWFMFGPRTVRAAACAVLIALQSGIALTGNYAFFNLLTIALSLMLLDDAAFELKCSSSSSLRVFVAARTRRGFGGKESVKRRAGTSQQCAAWTLALVTVPVSVVTLTGQMGIRLPGSTLTAPLAAFVEPFRSVNAYGLFAVMTTTRPEIIVEGSNDGVTWLPYEFKYKPGDVRQRPRWVAPFQPRLDWQMWFAALSRFEQEAWFQSFCIRLLEGSPSVTRLLAHDPFEGTPPHFVRGVLYLYRFADAETRRTAQVWWTRAELEPYSPALSLRQR
jgi:hypothetical protein